MVVLMIEEQHERRREICRAGWLAIPEIPEICNYIMYGEIVYLKKRLKVLPSKISAGEEQHFRTVFHGLAFYCTELCLNLADK